LAQTISHTVARSVRKKLKCLVLDWLFEPVESMDELVLCTGVLEDILPFGLVGKVWVGEVLRKVPQPPLQHNREIHPCYSIRSGPPGSRGYSNDPPKVDFNEH
jgi:hypothetical protein